MIEEQLNMIDDISSSSDTISEEDTLVITKNWKRVDSSENDSSSFSFDNNKQKKKMIKIEMINKIYSLVNHLMKYKK